MGDNTAASSEVWRDDEIEHASSPIASSSTTAGAFSRRSSNGRVRTLPAPGFRPITRSPSEADDDDMRRLQAELELIEEIEQVAAVSNNAAAAPQPPPDIHDNSLDADHVRLLMRELDDKASPIQLFVLLLHIVFPRRAACRGLMQKQAADLAHAEKKLQQASEYGNSLITQLRAQRYRVIVYHNKTSIFECYCVR